MPAKIPYERSVEAERGPVVFQSAGSTRGAFGETQAEEAGRAISGQRQQVQADAAGFRLASEAGGRVAAAGNSLTQAGANLSSFRNEMVEAARRLDERQDAIVRAEAEGAITDFLEKAFLSEKNNSGFRTQQSVTSFREVTLGGVQKQLGEYAGKLLLPASGLTLQESAAKLVNKYHSNAVNAGIEAGREALKRSLGQTVASLTQAVSDNPGTLADAMLVLRGKIDKDFRPGSTPEDTAAAQQAGLEQLAIAAVDHYINLGDYDTAQSIMSQPNVAALLNPDRARALRISLISGKAQQLKSENEMRAKIGLWRFLTNGKELSLEDTRVLLTLALPRKVNELTAQEKLDIYRKVRSEEPPPEVVAKALELYVAPVLHVIEAGQKLVSATGKVVHFSPKVKTWALSPGDIVVNEENEVVARGPAANLPPAFGNSASGLAHTMLAQNAEAFGFNMLTPQEDALFLQAVSIVTAIDPLTRSRQELSPVVRQALSLRGIDPDKVNRLNTLPPSFQPRQPPPAATGPRADSGPGMSRAAERVPTAAEVRRVQQDANQALAAARARNPVDSDVAPASPELARVKPGGIRFFNGAAALTGVLSGLTAAGAPLPIVGGEFEAGDEVTGLRNQFEVFKGALAAALQRTVRYADAERQDIMKRQLAPLESSIWRRPKTLMVALARLDQWLEEEQVFVATALNDPNAYSGEGRAAAMDRLQDIKFARSLIGAPRAEEEDQIPKVIARFGLKPGDYLVFQGELYKLAPERGVRESE